MTLIIPWVNFSQQMTTELIFVYGTLRKEIATNMSAVLARHCSYFADGYLQGKLYEVNGYPAAIESNNPDDKVYGELYKITDNLILSELDTYEECTNQFPEPYEYIRKKQLITLSDNSNLTAWVYIFNRDVLSLIPIKSGDYLKHFLALQHQN